MKTMRDDFRISAYLLGELNPEEAAAFEKELMESPELAAELKAFEKVGMRIRTSLQQQQEFFSLSERQRGVVRRRMEEAGSAPRLWWPSFMHFLNQSGGVFACSLLLVGLCLFAFKDTVLVPALKQTQHAMVGSTGVAAPMDAVVEEPLSEPVELQDRTVGLDKAPETLHASSGVPVLGDIPMNGRLFRSNESDLKKSGVMAGEQTKKSALVEESAWNETISGMAYDKVPSSRRPLRGRFSNEVYEEAAAQSFQNVQEQALSTFSIDVDTASYTNLRRLINQGTLPPAGAVRIEEMLNYFTYDYSQPEGRAPFSVAMEIAACPWNPQHRLARVGIQGRSVPASQRAALNLVFLIDVSGSMSDENKLPLVKKALKLLVNKLNPGDRVALVTYAGRSRLALPSTPASQKHKILQALNELDSGGGTNGEGGILRAYQVARENFIKKGINRVIMATDGDFNVGVSNREELVELIQREAQSGVYLNIFGFGMGNLKDSTLEQLADKGNGIYGYIDSYQEARRVFAEQVERTLVTIAKDVKIQVEFNPAKVVAYRLIGYDNRLLNKEDFNDDRKDAGEVGAGHSVTALYELIPPGADDGNGKVDPLKYQLNPVSSPRLSAAGKSGEVLTLKLRYKNPAGGSSNLLKVAAEDAGYDWQESSADFRFAASVAAFGMILQDSPDRGNADRDLVESLAEGALGEDPGGSRREFLKLVRAAYGLR